MMRGSDRVRIVGLVLCLAVALSLTGCDTAPEVSIRINVSPDGSIDETIVASGLPVDIDVPEVSASAWRSTFTTGAFEAVGTFPSADELANAEVELFGALAAALSLPEGYVVSVAERSVLSISESRNGFDRLTEVSYTPMKLDVAPEDCFGCGGTTLSPCVDCSGTASIDCTGCVEGRYACGACGADGKVTCRSCGGDGMLTCSACGGTGTRRVTGECTSCDGSGYFPSGLQCWTCDGTGTYSWLEPCPSCPRGLLVDGDMGSIRPVGTVDCSRCNRTGIQDCPSCDGQGDVGCAQCDEAGVVDCTACAASGEVACVSCDGDGGATESDVEAVRAVVDSVRFEFEVIFEDEDGTSVEATSGVFGGDLKALDFDVIELSKTTLDRARIALVGGAGGVLFLGGVVTGFVSLRRRSIKLGK